MEKKQETAFIFKWMGNQVGIEAKFETQRGVIVKNFKAHYIKQQREFEEVKKEKELIEFGVLLKKIEL